MIFILLFIIIVDTFGFKDGVKIRYDLHKNAKRSVLPGDSRKFKMPIKYKIGNGLFANYMRKAVKNVQDNTCIEFEEVDYYTYADIEFKWGSGCGTSGIGHILDSTQYIYIYHYCYDNVIFIQALLHETLGVHFQHTRYDSYMYITIKKDNIQDRNNYRLFNPLMYYYTTFGIGYDYGSIMHWRKNDFAKPYKRTIFANEFDEYYQNMMGQKEMVSFNDYKILNFYYCGDKCNNSISCQYNGYQNPKKCNECLCPHGFQGQNCKDFVKWQGWHGVVWDTCGPLIVNVKEWSETFRLKSKYICYIYLVAPVGKRILLTMEEASTSNASPCLPGKSIEIRYRGDKGSMGLCMCGYNKKVFNIESEDNLIVIFYIGHAGAHEIDFKYKILKENMAMIYRRYK
uniref:Metalloendopeptidase n=1 Tax=Parastrongyloides trichosuri TaxID=131310 RepID=A0A0N4ZI29_PARTI